MSEELVSFFAHGVPIPQGSKRLGKHGTRFVVLDDNDAALKPWRRAVAQSARVNRVKSCPWDGPVSLLAIFYLPRPVSVKRAAPQTRPDLSKLVRAIEDSLTEGGVWTDDSRVVELAARKHYADDTKPCGVHIEVRPI